MHFYPRSPCGERRVVNLHANRHRLFLSTLSLRRATRLQNPIKVQIVFLSTLSLRRATILQGKSQFYDFYFYPRSPCGERPLKLSKFEVVVIFLSTLSLRRATFNGLTKDGCGLDFYPRSPCGERLIGPVSFFNTFPFLSTLSLRRATSCTSMGRPKRLYFYPRSPCGERHAPSHSLYPSNYFYPRSPCGERPLTGTMPRGKMISIHALLAESDRLANYCERAGMIFLSTLSLRRATK